MNKVHNCWSKKFLNHFLKIFKGVSANELLSNWGFPPWINNNFKTIIYAFWLDQSPFFSFDDDGSDGNFNNEDGGDDDSNDSDINVGVISGDGEGCSGDDGDGGSSSVRIKFLVPENWFWPVH